jgi:hypothetical protein
MQLLASVVAGLSAAGAAGPSVGQAELQEEGLALRRRGRQVAAGPLVDLAEGLEALQPAVEANH